tara:strand:- start:643 stop:906 length:264 start_codon:yes stop_codon:yes gene_type:complete
MAYDFLKNFVMFEDEDRFNRLCQAFEDLVRNFEDEEGKVTDAEIMQALDMVGFSLFRDSWEEFKKLDLHRDFPPSDIHRNKGKKFLN